MYAESTAILFVESTYSLERIQRLVSGIQEQIDTNLSAFLVWPRKVFHVITAQYNIKGSRNIQGFASRLVVPTLDTKVTEYLCSVFGFFFFRQISTFQLAIFDGIFLSFKKYCCPELKFEKIFHP